MPSTSLPRAARSRRRNPSCGRARRSRPRGSGLRTRIPRAARKASKRRELRACDQCTSSASAAAIAQQAQRFRLRSSCRGIPARRCVCSRIHLAQRRRPVSRKRREIEGLVVDREHRLTIVTPIREYRRTFRRVLRELRRRRRLPRPRSRRPPRRAPRDYRPRRGSIARDSTARRRLLACCNAGKAISSSATISPPFPIRARRRSNPNARLAASNRGVPLPTRNRCAATTLRYAPARRATPNPEASSRAADHRAPSSPRFKRHRDHVRDIVDDAERGDDRRSGYGVPALRFVVETHVARDERRIKA